MSQIIGLPKSNSRSVNAPLKRANTIKPKSELQPASAAAESLSAHAAAATSTMRGFVGNPPISKIPDETLSMAMTYLNPKEQNQAREVNFKFKVITYESRHQESSLTIRRDIKNIQGFLKSYLINNLPNENLKSLEFYGNKYLTNDDLSFIVQNFPNLTSLSIRDTSQITDEGLVHIAALKYLVSLNIEHCWKITDALFLHIVNLTNLASLSFTGLPNITDTAIAHLVKLKSLESLDLWNCNQITCAGIAKLAVLENFTSLIFGTNEKLIHDEDISHIAKLKKLTSLDIRGSCFNEITDTGIEYLRELQELTTLRLEYVTDVGLAHLSTLINLTCLKFQSKNQVTDAGIKHLTALKNLASLTIMSTSITDTGISYIATLTSLTSLEIWNIEQISDVGIEYLTALKNLTYLFLWNCIKITDASIKHFSALKKLTKLCLIYCYQMTPEARLIQSHFFSWRPKKTSGFETNRFVNSFTDPQTFLPSV